MPWGDDGGRFGSNHRARNDTVPEFFKLYATESLLCESRGRALITNNECVLHNGLWLICNTTPWRVRFSSDLGRAPFR